MKSINRHSRDPRNSKKVNEKIINKERYSFYAAKTIHRRSKQQDSTTYKIKFNGGEGNSLLSYYDSREHTKAPSRRTLSTMSFGNANSRSTSLKKKQNRSSSGSHYYRSRRFVSTTQKREKPIKGTIKHMSANLSKQRVPEKTMSSVQLLTQIYREGDYKRGLSTGEDLIKANNGDAEILYITGLCASMLQFHNKTIALFERLINSSSKAKLSVYILLAISYKAQGMIDKSIHFLDEALKRNPRFYEALVTHQNNTSGLQR